jgi:hypothetical protein
MAAKCSFGTPSRSVIAGGRYSLNAKSGRPWPGSPFFQCFKIALLTKANFKTERLKVSNQN